MTVRLRDLADGDLTAPLFFQGYREEEFVLWPEPRSI